MRPRWWPLVVILAGWILALGWTWARSAQFRQDQVVATMVATFVALLAALIWFLAGSALPWRTRAIGGGLIAALLLTGLATLRFAGVTGDVRPIFAWRWSRSASEVPAIDLDTVPALDTRPTLADSPQFLGPRRIGVIDGVLLARTWEGVAPRELWRRSIGAGWGSFAIQGDIAVTLEQRGEQEAVVAYALLTGEPVWYYAYDARYDNPVAGLGPRSTPTIVGDRVYSMGATGQLTAIDLASGQLLWARDVLQDNDARPPGWGKSCSPLVLGGRVVVSAGGRAGRSLVAYATVSGEPLWSGGDSGSGYSSPLLATLARVPQILILNADSLASHDPLSGAELWSVPWPSGQPNVAQPLVVGPNAVVVSSGYGTGAKRIELAPDDNGALVPRIVWESIRLKAKFAHFVLHDGTIYGLDDGILTAIDPVTGARLWKRGRYGHGQLLLVEDLLLVQAERGDLVLVNPNPIGLNELGRVPALAGKTWNVPTMAGNRLLVRNDREAALFELPIRR